MKNYHLSTCVCLLSLFAVGEAFADDRGTNAIPTTLLEKYTGQVAAPRNKVAHFVLPGMADLYTYSGSGKISNNVRPELPELLLLQRRQFRRAVRTHWSKTCAKRMIALRM